MLILGIDPGTATTGWGLIEIQNSKWRRSPSASQRKSQNFVVGKNKSKARKQNSKLLALIDYGCIVTKPTIPFPQRLSQLRKNLRQIIISKKPDVVCVEEHFFGKNKKTAMVVSQARGVILETAASLKTQIYEYQGFAIKHALTGERYAKKKRVEMAVKKLLGKRKLAKPSQGFIDDAVDGLAVAVYHSLNSS